MTLLDTARTAVKRRVSSRSYDQDELQDLALAWVRSEVTTAQAFEAIGKRSRGSNGYAVMAVALRNAVQDGKVTIT